MKHMAIAVLLFLVCQLFLVPARPAASQTQAPVDWNIGYYQGTVSLVMNVYASEDRSVVSEGSGSARLIENTHIMYNSKGWFWCYVMEGNAVICAGIFPTNKLDDSVIVLTADPDCNLTREQKIGYTYFLKPSPPAGPISGLNVGFSIPFDPLYAQDKIENKSSLSGSPGCDALAKYPYQSYTGITNWEDLRFTVNYHAERSASGTCTMEYYPKHFSEGYAVIDASIQRCNWVMYLVDLKANQP